jgi:hypothetical protein
VIHTLSPSVFSIYLRHDQKRGEKGEGEKMKKFTENEIESGLDIKKNFILKEILEEEYAERWLKNFLDHPITLKHVKTADSIPISKERHEDE